MKSQIGFEFYFSIMAFALVVIWVFLQVLRYYPTYLDEMKYEVLKSEAWQLSEILINDPGEPPNWEPTPTWQGKIIWWVNNVLNPNSIKRIGLNDETENKTNLISKIKAETFNSTCTLKPDWIQRWLDTNYTFSVYLVDSDGNVLISCKHLVPSRYVINVTRVVAIHDTQNNKINYGELTLELS